MRARYGPVPDGHARGASAGNSAQIRSPAGGYGRGAGCHVEPFQASERPEVMQLVALPQVMALVQKQVPNPLQITPRAGETSCQDLVVAFQASADARPPPWTSLKKPPTAMQKVPAQETAFRAAGFPSLGGDPPPHAVPFQALAMEIWTGSWEIVSVPTATQLDALPQATLARPHGNPGGPPQASVFCAQIRHLLPFHDSATPPLTCPSITMHSERFPQDTPPSRPAGLVVV